MESRSGRWVSHAIVCLLGIGCSLGCEPDEPSETACPHRASFRLQVLDPPVCHPGTELTLRYGGGEVVYRVAGTNESEGVLFCECATTGGQATLVCDVWTRGAVQVEVKVPGYEPAVVDLAVETDAGCITTHAKTIRITEDPR